MPYYFCFIVQLKLLQHASYKWMWPPNLMRYLYYGCFGMLNVQEVPCESIQQLMEGRWLNNVFDVVKLSVGIALYYLHVQYLFVNFVVFFSFLFFSFLLFVCLFVCLLFFFYCHTFFYLQIVKYCTKIWNSIYPSEYDFRTRREFFVVVFVVYSSVWWL